MLKDPSIDLSNVEDLDDHMEILMGQCVSAFFSAEAQKKANSIFDLMEKKIKKIASSATIEGNKIVSGK
jgi:hypothetical protein